MENNVLPSLLDSTELKNIIINNPELPIIIKVKENTYNNYRNCTNVKCIIESVVLHNNQWETLDEFEENIRNEFGENNRYHEYSDRDYEIEIDNIVVNAPSIKAIIIGVS